MRDGPDMRIHRVNLELYELGIEVKSSGGAVVKACCTNRAVADIISQGSFEGADWQLVCDVLAGYFRRRDAGREMHLRKRLEKELRGLWTGEIAATAMFWFCYFQLPKVDRGGYLMQSTVYPLLVLSFILVQGALYWWILYRRLAIGRAFARKAGRVYGVLKIIDIALLCLGIPVAALTHGRWPSTMIGILVLLFAFIEWVNYYKIRLSYSPNPLVLLRRIKTGTLKKSRLAREIDKR